MPCCGQQRAELRKTGSAGHQTAPQLSANNNAVPIAATGTSYATPLLVLYLESSPILVAGTTTGKQYRFSAAHPVQSVDAGDAAALLRTRFFRRV